MTWTGNHTVREGRIKPIAEPPPLTKEEAKAQFVALVRNFGLRWSAATVQSKAAWDMLARCNAVLDENDKREALGLLRKPYP